MTEATQTPKEEILPNNKHGNGTTERMIQIDVDPSFAGFRHASARLLEWTVTGEIDQGVSRAAGVHAANGITAGKAEMSGYRNIEKSKHPSIQRAIAELTGGGAKELLLALPKKEEPAKN